MRKSDNLAFPELTSHHSFLWFCVGIEYWIKIFFINLRLDWYIVVVIFDFTYHIFWIHYSISFKKEPFTRCMQHISNKKCQNYLKSYFFNEFLFYRFFCAVLQNSFIDYKSEKIVKCNWKWFLQLIQLEICTLEETTSAPSPAIICNGSDGWKSRKSMHIVN